MRARGRFSSVLVIVTCLCDLTAQERYSYSTFDRQFLKDFGYDQKLHRDDREHFKARGLQVNDEVFSISMQHTAL